MTTDVTVVGLGAMGAALARGFQQRGLTVTVWNRTAAKTTPLADEGAQVADSVPDAVAASPLLVTCLMNYDQSFELFADPTAQANLAGRTVINTASASPREVREFADFAAGAGAGYIDGKLMTYPAGIGRPDTVILTSGDSSLFQTHRDALTALGGGLTHLSDDVTAAATVYQAVWVYYYSGLFGFMESAAYLERSGVSIDTFLSLAERASVDLGRHLTDVTRRVQAGNYAGDQAAVGTYVDGFRIMSEAFADAGVESEMLKAIRALTDRANQVHPTEDIAALVEVLAHGELG
jgi:3-hydroxyisobutyrate dehydrogenase-like beta-hydroxyacid dehydrogenase